MNARITNDVGSGSEGSVTISVLKVDFESNTSPSFKGFVPLR